MHEIIISNYYCINFSINHELRCLETFSVANFNLKLNAE